MKRSGPRGSAKIIKKNGRQIVMVAALPEFVSVFFLLFPLCLCVTEPPPPGGESGRVQNLEFDESHLERGLKGSLKKAGR